MVKKSIITEYFDKFKKLWSILLALLRLVSIFFYFFVSFLFNFFDFLKNKTFFSLKDPIPSSKSIRSLWIYFCGM